MKADAVVDARGLLCPLPILRARKALGGMQGGQVLEVLATDPGAPSDFEDFCRLGGHSLIETATLGDAYRIVIRRGG